MNNFHNSAPLMNKAQGSAAQPSRQLIFGWIHSLLNDVPLALKVEELGKGSIYCRILNHYFPGVILASRIIWQPKSEYENLINLRMLQNAFLQLKVSIAFDPIKLSKEKLNDNWAFVVALHRYLTQNCEDFQPRNAPEELKLPTFYHSFGNLMGPKRSLEHVYPDPFMQGMLRQPFYPIENIYQQKNTYTASSKYSVGKLYKEPLAMQGSNSPNKGKWSVNSHMFQNNLVPIIDRVKEILLKSSHDTEKIRQVKMLLNIPLNEEVIVKVEEDENSQIIKINPETARKDNASSSTLASGEEGK